MDKDKFVQWLKNKRSYAQGHLNSKDISDDDFQKYATQNGLLLHIIKKIERGDFKDNAKRVEWHEEHKPNITDLF
jgi:hypothetical protein